MSTFTGNQMDFIMKNALFVVLCLGFCLNSLAQDWTQWRGPNRDGKAPAFLAPKAWPQTLTPKWTVTVGKGDTSPALSGGRLFTFGRKDASEWVQCLDAESGKVLWEKSYAEPFVVEGPSARHPGPRGSVAVAGERVITLGIAGVLTCWNAADGAVLWRKASTNDYDGVGYHSDTSMSPLLVDDLCLVHVSGGETGTILAMELANGKIRWKISSEPSISSSPVVAVLGGVRQVVTLSAKELMGLELATGKLLWHTPFESTRGNCTTPVIDGSHVLVTGESRGLVCMEIEKQGEQFHATALWTNMPLVSRMTTPVVRDGFVYGFGTQFFCADARTGQTKWIVKGGPAAGYYGGIVDCGSVILGQTLKGDLVFFKPDSSAYTEIARYKVTETELWALPLVSGSRIYVRDAESVSLWNLSF